MMDEVGNCDDRKRKLPLWMLGVAAADQVRKSAKEDRIHLSLDKNVTNEAEDANCLRPRRRMTGKIERDMDLRNSTSNCEPPKKGKRRRQSIRASCEYQSSENEVIENKPLSVKGQKADCESRHLGKESSRRFEKEDITDEEEDSEIENEYFDTEETRGRSKKLGRNNTKADKRRNNAKSRQKNSRRITHKASKTKTNDYENCESMKSQSSCGEDCDSEIELTVDDLMHMAEEHVKSDRGKENQKVVVEKSTSKAQCLSTLVSENKNCDLLVNGSVWRASKCSSSATASNDYGIGEETGKSLDGGVLPMENRTGDPKVDLLDVFLGPLIRKPQNEEKKVEPVLDGFILSGGDKRQLMTNTLVGNEALVMKKKSSLRDKVAMFLG